MDEAWFFALYHELVREQHPVHECAHWLTAQMGHAAARHGGLAPPTTNSATFSLAESLVAAAAKFHASLGIRASDEECPACGSYLCATYALHICAPAFMGPTAKGAD